MNTAAKESSGVFPFFRRRLGKQDHLPNHIDSGTHAPIAGGSRIAFRE
jgi:hypothetical protein